MNRVFVLLVILGSLLFSPVTGYAEMPRGSLVYSGEDTKAVLQQKTEYNRAYWTLFSLIASSAAYAPEHGIEAEYLRGHGWEFAPNRTVVLPSVIRLGANSQP